MHLTHDFIIFIIALSFAITLCAYFARSVLWPRLVALPRTEAVVLLLWPHTLRFVNLMSATNQQVNQGLPHAWRQQIAWGDFTAGCLALLAIWALRRRTSMGIALAWIATVFGLCDFSNSMIQATRLGVIDQPLGFLWFIAAAIVPMLATCHVTAAWRLLRTDRDTGVA